MNKKSLLTDEKEKEHLLNAIYDEEEAGPSRRIDLTRTFWTKRSESKCPLWGVKRTLALHHRMSAFDPMRTFATRAPLVHAAITI